MANRTNNVKRVANFLGLDRPMFMDYIKGGYKCKWPVAPSDIYEKMGISGKTELEQAIKDQTGVVVKVTPATCRFYNAFALHIPYAEDDEKLVYKVKY